MFKDGSVISNQFQPGVTWSNGTEATVFWPLTTDRTFGAIDHCELEFQSHAGPFEGTDNWDVAQVYI